MTATDTGAVSYATESLVVKLNGSPIGVELSDRLLAVSVEDSVATRSESLAASR